VSHITVPIVLCEALATVFHELNLQQPQLKSTQGQLEVTQDQFKKLLAERDESVRARLDLVTQLEHARRDHAQGDSARVHVERERDDARRAIKLLEDALTEEKHARAEKDAELVKLRGQNAVLAGDLQERSENVALLQSQLEQLRVDKAALTASLRQAERSLDQASSEMAGERAGTHVRVRVMTWACAYARVCEQVSRNLCMYLCRPVCMYMCVASIFVYAFVAGMLCMYSTHMHVSYTEVVLTEEGTGEHVFSEIWPVWLFSIRPDNRKLHCPGPTQLPHASSDRAA
jgi:hypothetical protein